MQGESEEGGEGVAGQAPSIIKKVIAGGGHHGSAWKVPSLMLSPL